MPYSNIQYRKTEGVAHVTLARPEVLNALDLDTLRELNDAFDAIEADRDVEIVVLRGEGRAFSAGGDLKRHVEVHRDVGYMREMSDCATRVMQRIGDSPRLFIAVVTGLCVAGGIELILPCDFVLASEEARFSDGHMNVSLLPGAGGTQRMPRLIGALRAKDLILTARFIEGREAAEMGLVTTCVPGSEIESKLEQLITTLRQKSFAARRAVKYLVNQGLKGSLEAGLHLEKSYVLHFETSDPDAHEGLVAFCEKRKPKFRRPS
jgi:enoyl-CoA hydratase